MKIIIALLFIIGCIVGCYAQHNTSEKYKGHDPQLAECGQNDIAGMPVAVSTNDFLVYNQQRTSTYFFTRNSVDYPDFKSTSHLNNDSLKWIEPYLHQIKNEEKTFDDLQFLKKEIGDKRIVALGEQTHQDGKTFEARARLVDFLIREMDFDVVLYEAGMVDMFSANVLFKVSKKADSVRKRLYWFWQTNQSKRMYEAIETHSYKVNVGGFDCKFTSALTFKGKVLSTVVLDTLKKHAPNFTSDGNFMAYINFQKDIELKGAKGGLNMIRYKMSKKEKESYLASSEKVIIKLRELQQNEIAQLVESSVKGICLYSELSIGKALFNKKWMNTLNNERDKLMAENLLYLVNEKFKNKKVILIGANYHFIRNNNLITNGETKGLLVNKSTILGDLVYSSLKNEVYTICFTAYQGTYGLVRNENQKASKVKPPKDNSIEYVLNKTNYEQAFLSLRNSASEVFWKREPGMRIFDYESHNTATAWPSVFDGLFYIKTMEPVLLQYSKDK